MSDGRAMEGETPSVALTPRQREVLSWIASGYSNKRVAGFLNIAEGTVKAHIKHVMRKIKVGNRTQAALWLLRQHRRPLTRRRGGVIPDNTGVRRLEVAIPQVCITLDEAALPLQEAGCLCRMHQRQCALSWNIVWS
jgi:DNA-binding CsgD family transcriptional regulator